MTEQPKHQILVVDDTIANVDILVENLGEEYDVIVALDGPDALSMAEESHPDLILLDIMMPGMDGYEVCTQIKANPEIHDTPVIFLSALQDTSQKVRGLSLGAVDYITKPFDIEEVKARVRRQLELLEDRRHLIQENQRLMATSSREGMSSEERSLWVLKKIQEGEGEFTEFKSTIRWNIRAEKKDMAVELAWLKTIVAYLNSSGGVLLVGVDDAGTPLGLDTDAFDNEDKLLLHVNNRIQQNIGMEFASSIRYSLETVEEKRVLVVECTPASEPAFLINGKDESFFIRIGPGSRKLSPRQILAYLSEREKAAGNGE